MQHFVHDYSIQFKVSNGIMACISVSTQIKGYKRSSLVLELTEMFLSVYLLIYLKVYKQKTTYTVHLMRQAWLQEC